MGLRDSQVSGTCRDRHTPEGPWVAQTGQGPSDGPGQNENTSLSLAWGRMQLSINQAGRYGWAGSEKQETGHEESWQGEKLGRSKLHTGTKTEENNLLTRR